MATMNRIQVASLMHEQGMIPLFYEGDAEQACRLLQAIYDGGGRLLEFTHRGDFAQEVFRELHRYSREHLPGMVIGVGSITDAGTASYYMSIGADFIVTPVYREDIAMVCNRRKVLWSPGCGSLTEIARAEEMGCEIVKLFPGSIYGPGFIKAARAPQPWTNIMPTGGVSPDRDNLTGWFSAGAYCVGMGSKLIKKQADGGYDFDHITLLTRDTLALISDIRSRL